MYHGFHKIVFLTQQMFLEQQINILECFFERSRDTEDWSNNANKNQVWYHMNKLYIKIYCNRKQLF